MGTKPIDYSRWGHIDVSDDEDLQHPNIDKESLWRWEKQSRYERYAREAAEKEKVHKETQRAKALLIEAKTEPESAKLSVAEAEKQYEDFRKKEEEIERQEKLHPKWNSSNMCTVKKDKAVINTKAFKKESDKTEQEIQREQDEYFRLHKHKITKLGKMKLRKDACDYLKKEPVLLNDYCANYLVVWCVDSQIDDETQDLVPTIAQNCVIIQHMLEILKVGKQSPMEIINNFFDKTSEKTNEYEAVLKSETDALVERVKKRAEVRIQEAVAKYEKEEKEKRIQASPGGLDPEEVFNSLPKQMQEAFESREVSRLQECATTMDYKEFKYHYDRCVKSGLWCPGPDDDDDEDDGAAADTEDTIEK